MKKTLIMIGAALETTPAIRQAIEMGIHVVATDRDPNAPGFAHASESVIACVYTPEETVRALKKWAENGGKPDGVMCAAVDTPRTVAAVAEAFGLRAVSAQTAFLATDKLAMKDHFKANGIPIPWYSEISSASELKFILSQRKESLVIKPVDSRGARGVLKLEYGSSTMPDLDWTFESAKKESPTNRVMVETYLDGPQISTEGFVVNGKTYTPGFSDRNYELMARFAPNIIEDGGQLPSFLPEETQLAVKALAERASLVLGIENGVAKGDMVVHQGKPYVIEMAARLSGGYFCSHEIPWNTGVDFVGIAIKLAIGETPNPEEMIPSYQKGVAQRYLFPEPGIVANIQGVEEAKKGDGVRMVEIRVKVGDTIPPTTNHPARAGVVIAVAETREEAVTAAEKAINCLKITTHKA